MNQPIFLYYRLDNLYQKHRSQERLLPTVCSSLAILRYLGPLQDRFLHQIPTIHNMGIDQPQTTLLSAIKQPTTKITHFRYFILSRYISINHCQHMILTDILLYVRTLLFFPWCNHATEETPLHHILFTKKKKFPGYTSTDLSIDIEVCLYKTPYRFYIKLT